MGRSRNSALASRSIRNRPRCPPAREAGGHRRPAPSWRQSPAGRGQWLPRSGARSGSCPCAGPRPRWPKRWASRRRLCPSRSPASKPSWASPWSKGAAEGASVLTRRRTPRPARRDGNRGHLSEHRLRLVRQGGRDAPRPADRNPRVGQPRQRLFGDRSRGLPPRRLRAEDPRASSRFRGRAGDRGGRLLRRDPTALQAGGHRPKPVSDRARFAHRPADLVGVPPE